MPDPGSPASSRPSWRGPVIVAVLIGAAIGAKVLRDLSLDEAPFGGQLMQRDLGRYALETGCVEAADALRISDPERTALDVLQVGGSRPQAPPQRRATGPGDAPAWSFDFVLEETGYVAIDLPVWVERDWILRSHLTLCLRGAGLPISLQVALDGPGDHGPHRTGNQLALATTDWTALRIPLLRLLGPDGTPWRGGQGEARVQLTMLPFSGWQADDLQGVLEIAWVALEGDASPAFDAARRAEIIGDPSAPAATSAQPMTEPWASCDDDATTLHFGSSPSVVPQLESPCSLRVALEEGEWLIWRWPLPAPPEPLDPSARLIIRGHWPSTLRTRVSLRQGDRVRSDPSIWREPSPGTGAREMAIDASRLGIATASGSDAPWMLDLDLHPGGIPGREDHLGIESIRWERP